MSDVCAITGSNGYVGGCVKRYFSAKGWGILELVRRPQGGTQARFQLGEAVSPERFRGVGTLVHCAYDFKPLGREEMRDINVRGTERLLGAAREAGVARMVCVSSISAYEGCRSLYGRTKLEIERVARAQGAQIVRPGLVHGGGPGGMFGKLAGQVHRASIIPLMGDGSQIQYLLHEEDLASFLEKYARGRTPPLPPVLTAAHPQPWPLKALLEEIARRQNKPVRFIRLPWRLIWAGLKGAEACGWRMQFRSDSLVSLMHQNPRPDFSANAACGLECRPF